MNPRRMGRSPGGGADSTAADEGDANVGGADEGFRAGQAVSQAGGPGADWRTSLGTCCSWSDGVAPALDEEAPSHTKPSGRPDLGSSTPVGGARAAVGRLSVRRMRREECGYSEEAAARGDWAGRREPVPERGRPVEADPFMDDEGRGSLGTDRYEALCPVAQRNMGTDRYVALCPVARQEETQGGGRAPWEPREEAWAEEDEEHDPFCACRVGEASNPGPRGGALGGGDAVCSPAPTASPVPTDLSAPTTMADTPSSSPCPVGALMRAFDAMDASGGGEAGGHRRGGEEHGTRHHKRWQAKGEEVCACCGEVPPRGRWAYTCSERPAFYCNARCRNRAFELHVCADVTARGSQWAPTTLPRDRAVLRVEAKQIDAAIVAATEREVDAHLTKAVARPALRTMESIPRQHRARTADVLRDLMHAHVDAQRAATRGGQAAAAGALRAARMLRVAPALLLRASRRHMDDGLAPPPAQMGARGVERAQEVRQRLQLAEAGAWPALLTQYLQDLKAADEVDQRRSVTEDAHSMPLQVVEDSVVFQRAASKAAGGALRSAADILLGAVHAPLNEATAQAVDALVAVPVPEEELRAQRLEVELAAPLAQRVEPVRHGAVRRRLRVLNAAAQPGPSSWRNNYLIAVGETKSGVAALARWSTMWAKGAVTVEVAKLWTAAVVSPIDCGEAASADGLPAARKLRPIACSEALMKLAEGVVLDAMAKQMEEVFEPRQLGCGAPDGAGVIVSLRSWVVEARQGHEGRQDDPEALVGLDYENAYGRAFRSACMRGARRRMPALAPMIAGQWQTLGTPAWQRSEGHWRCTEAVCGGWQGSRLMQVCFASGLEEGLDDVVMLSRVGGAAAVARVGHQDDTYIVGSSSSLRLATRTLRSRWQRWATG